MIFRVIRILIIVCNQLLSEFQNINFLYPDESFGFMMRPGNLLSSEDRQRSSDLLEMLNQSLTLIFEKHVEALQTHISKWVSDQCLLTNPVEVVDLVTTQASGQVSCKQIQKLSDDTLFFGHIADIVSPNGFTHDDTEDMCRVGIKKEDLEMRDDALRACPDRDDARATDTASTAVSSAFAHPLVLTPSSLEARHGNAAAGGPSSQELTAPRSHPKATRSIIKKEAPGGSTKRPHGPPRPKCELKGHGGKPVEARACKVCVVLNLDRCAAEVKAAAAAAASAAVTAGAAPDIAFAMLQRLGKASGTYWCPQCLQEQLLDDSGRRQHLVTLARRAEAGDGEAERELAGALLHLFRQTNKCKAHDATHRGGMCPCDKMWRACLACRRARRHPYAGLDFCLEGDTCPCAACRK